MSKTVYVVAERPEAFAELLPGAATLGDEAIAVFVGDKGKADKVFSLGAKKLLNAAAKDGQIFENYAATIAKAIEKTPEALVLLPATKQGKAMAAKLGALLKAAVVNDVNAFGADGALGRMFFGGLAQGTEKPLTKTVIVTVAPGVFEAKEGGAGTGEVEELAFVEPAHPVTLKESKPRAASSVDIGKAKRVVGVGRGFGKKEDLALAKALADAIDAELGCSRPIAEGEQWMERERYIGVSGATIKPDVYVAIGISGQVQHMVGARDSHAIVAINKDKNAPIFKQCDYGIIGDLYKVLPALKKILG